MGQLVSITPPAGVVQNGTPYSAKGRYVDSDLVRFKNSHLSPIGGWNRINTTAYSGGANKSLLAYRDNSGKHVLAVANATAVHVFRDGSNANITPTDYVGDTSTGQTLLGFGAYEYGVEDYGDARSQSGIKRIPYNTHLDTFGDHLLVCSNSDGRILRYRPDAGGGTPDTTLSALPNAPVDNIGVAVTNQRHVVALGAGGDPRSIKFSDQENSEVWAETTTNLAGEIILQTSGDIIGAVRYRNDLLIFTDQDVHRMYYVGAPLGYGIEKIGDGCGAISPRSIVSTSNFVSWIGANTPFIYDGAVRPLKCDVNDFLYDNLNREYSELVSGGNNSEFNEVWWFFPTGDDLYNSKYISWNYAENVWCVGTLDRQSWIDSPDFNKPVAADNQGNVFVHETGTLSGAFNIGLRTPFAQTSPLEISAGDRIAYVSRLYPDEESSVAGSVSFDFKGRQNPVAPETDLGSFVIDADGYTDCRFSARQVQVTINGATDRLWKLGNVRAEVAVRGRR